MRIEEMVTQAEQGALMTRSGYGDDFVTRAGGRLVRGHFIGETGFSDVRAYSFTEEDRAAEDWRPFVRVLPEAWEGCDMPNA